MKGAVKYPVSNGVNLYYIRAKRFKTVDIEVLFYMPLSSENASNNALIAPVLKSGCENYPTAKLLNRRLEELYGATMGATVSKTGESSIMRFQMQYVNNRFVGDSNIGVDALNLLCDVMFAPATENGCFKKEFFELERKNLLDSIEALMNDKKAYASWRCKEEMCKNEPFGIYTLGDASTIKGITAEGAYDFYKNKLTGSKTDIFICGDVDIDKAFDIIKNRFPEARTDEYPKTIIKGDVLEVKNIIEEMDVEQGKLSLGFRTGIAPDDKEFYALALYNKIFGGTATSKLFNNVREKLSLAYYVSSSVERFKGIMAINAGIEFPSFKAALDEIMVQFEAMKNGDFSDSEFNAAVVSSVNSIGQLADSPQYIIQYYAAQLPAGTFEDPEEYLENLKKVTREQVVAAANKIELDTVYFLKNKEAK